MAASSRPAGAGPSRRAFGMITGTGWGVAVGAVGCGVAAVLLRAPELGVLAVGCLAALVGGAGLVARRAHFEIDIEVVPARVARGEPAVASVTISNPGHRASWSARLVIPYGDQRSQVVVRPLPAGSRRTVGIPLPTDRRGLLRVGPVGVLTTDPFGLFSRYEALDGRAQLPVHPAAVALAPLPSARASSPDGLPVDSRVEGGVTFHALREYAPGDDLRHVHWRSSARAGTLLVRRHVDPSEPVTTIVLDNRRRAYLDGRADDAEGNGAEGNGAEGNDAEGNDAEGNDAEGNDARVFDVAVDVAASVVLASTRSRFPVRLHTTGGLRLDCRDRRDGDTAVLDALAGTGWADAADTDAAANTAAADGAAVGGGPGSGGGPAGGVRAAGDPLAEAARVRGRRGVGSLVVVTGPRDVGQLASAATLVSQFEQVVVLRVTGLAGPPPGERAAEASASEASAGNRPGAYPLAAGGRLRLLEIADTAHLASVWARGTGAAGRTRSARVSPALSPAGTGRPS
ncbi:Protein of unknown function DUF58 [Frankia sp. EI5c]|uniref:DUF58 domain-containing protein n=1 Tax=Frankia sp. EI5c TaxID=683316 RepID=UPI0007C31A72|nr:DUF58 domain-containing protein [Frankia sp. EI5c]OAA29499.1 Protein of unknown function DUF58 [Frankia sp. EI5c]